MINANEPVIKRISVEIEKIIQEKNRQHIITIEGPSGVGKSSISQSLKQKFADKITVIKGDYLLVNYKNRCARIKNNLNNPNFYVSNCWYHKNIKKSLKRSILNKVPSFEYQIHRNKKIRHIKIDLTAQILIIEGCFVSHKNNFGDISDMKIMLTTDPKTISRRRISRSKKLKKKINNSDFLKKFDHLYSLYLKENKIIESADLAIYMQIKL